MSATETIQETSAGVFHEALPLDSIAPSKTNPRKRFNSADLEELARSIKEKGVIQPIVVREHPTGYPLKKSGPTRFEIVAGERRWRASRIAGVATIPAIARTLDDTAVLEIQVIENGQREDVHELEEAHGYKTLINLAGYDVATIAERVSKSPEYVYGRLKLLNLIEPLQGKFLDGTITAGHAILFARLPADSQAAAAKRLYDTDYQHGKQEKHVISVRELAHWIQSEIQMDLSKTLFDKEDVKLVPAAGACSACPKRTGAEPQLWPELGKKDQCTDNSCFNKKLNAYIKREVDAGNLVRLTSDWSDRKKPGLYYDGDIREAKNNTCESTFLGVYVDGHRRGDTRTICIGLACKIHHGRNGSSGSERRIITPTEQFNNAKTSINLTVDAEHRRKIYEAVLPKLDLAATDIQKVAKQPVLIMILKMVYSRLDSTACRAVTEELKLKKIQYAQSADTGAIAEYAKKLDASRVLALIAKIAFKGYSMGFLPGEWEHDKTKVTRQFGELAQEYGVRLDPIVKEIETIKKERLAKAKERLTKAQAAKKPSKKKPQTSAKRKSKPVDPDPIETDDGDGDSGGGD